MAPSRLSRLHKRLVEEVVVGGGGGGGGGAHRSGGESTSSSVSSASSARQVLKSVATGRGGGRGGGTETEHLFGGRGRGRGRAGGVSAAAIPFASLTSPLVASGGSFACYFPPPLQPFIYFLEAIDSARFGACVTRSLIVALHILDPNSIAAEAGTADAPTGGETSPRCFEGVTERMLAARAVGAVLGVLVFGAAVRVRVVITAANVASHVLRAHHWLHALYCKHACHPLRRDTKPAAVTQKSQISNLTFLRRAGRRGVPPPPLPPPKVFLCPPRRADYMSRDHSAAPPHAARSP